MQNLEFLFAAYTVVWVLLFAYMFSIARRQKSLEKEIQQLASEREAGL